MAVNRPQTARQVSQRPSRCSSGARVTCNAASEPLATVNVGHSTNIRYHESVVTREDKELLLGQRGCVIWFTGKLT